MKLPSLQDWFSGLSLREQRIVQAGAVAAAVLLLVALLLPLHRKAVTLDQQIQRKRSDLAWMQAVAPALAAAGPAGAPASSSPESLIVLVDRTAHESGLAQALTGSQPVGDGALRVQLEKAQFNALVTWIAQLASQYGVRVDSATVDATGTPGVVNAGVVLRLR